MNRLVSVLVSETDAIVALFVERSPRSDPDVAARAGAMLDAVVRAVRGDGIEPPAVLSAGADLPSVVRAHQLLKDCVLARLEAIDCPIDMGGIRRLCDAFASVLVRAVERPFASAFELERTHLLDLFEQAPGFVAFLRGPDFVFELANPAYAQLVGHRDVLGRTAREALPEVEGQGFFELLDRVFSTGEAFVGRGAKILLQRRPGAEPEEAFLDFVYQPIRGTDGQIVGILAQGQDVTETKRQEAQRQEAEAAQRLSEARYRTLFESIDSGFCVMQLLFDAHDRPIDYRFLETNAAFENQTGLAGAVGRTALELVPTLDASWFERYGAVAKTGVPHRFESHAPAMGRWFDVYAKRVGDPALRQVALVFEDITDRKRAAAEREELLVRESAARREAEEASRVKDEFLATVSHELRTPLTSILGWVQMLQAGKLASDKHARALATIERNARAQARLIEELLDVSRILAGKLRLEVVPVEARTVVEQAIETARPAADAKGIRIQAVLASGGTVMGDAQRLQQMVWNLLSNAVKFTPKGGRIQVLVERRESGVDITVADTGIGIPSAFLPHVFERFRQVDGGPARAHGGLGLGLSIVRHLAEMHGGTVEGWSDGEGLGARFTLSLPLAVVVRTEIGPLTGSAVPHVPDGLPCPPELDGLRVLVVDDEQDTRDMLVALLEQCGMVVRTAASAENALAALADEVPDVLLSDIGMPVADGYALIEQVRRLPAPAGRVPAVALTAYARTEDRTRILLAGFDLHLPKPVEPLELLAVLSSQSGFLRRGRT